MLTICLPCLPFAFRKPVFGGAPWRQDQSPRPMWTRLPARRAKTGKSYGIAIIEAVRGFGIAAFRNGGKCYIAQYRKDGRSRRTRIGEHGRLTPEEARGRRE